MRNVEQAGEVGIGPSLPLRLSRAVGVQNSSRAEVQALHEYAGVAVQAMIFAATTANKGVRNAVENLRGRPPDWSF